MQLSKYEGKIYFMSEQQTKNPLHGITLEMMLNSLIEHFGWSELGRLINIRCFNNDPSVKSSLKFLRKTPWARTKVEELYISTQKKISNS
jgi:uncharacterized protein (DUF2132 family)